MEKLLDKEVHQLYKASPSDPDMSNYVVSSVSLSAKHGTAAVSVDAADGLMAGDEGLGADSQDEPKTEAAADAAAVACSQGSRTKSKSSAFLR